MQFQSKSLPCNRGVWWVENKRVLEPFLAFLSFFLNLFGSKAWGQKQGGVVGQSEMLEPEWNEESVHLGGPPSTVLELKSEHPWKVDDIGWAIKDWTRSGGIHTGAGQPAWVFRAWWGKSSPEEVAWHRCLRKERKKRAYTWKGQ